MKLIPLTQGIYAVVDDHWFEELNQHKWCAMKNGKLWYASRSVRQGKKMTHVQMHRVIMNAKPGEEIDHKRHYGDRVDNREDNLRFCSRLQNGRNRRVFCTNKTSYKGVSGNRRKYRAVIHHDGKQVFIGNFSNPIEAAHAYDVAATRLFGEFACLNFPDNQDKAA